MLTRDGCRERLDRFRRALPAEHDAAVVTLPEHLLYLANYFPDPNGLNLQSYAYLLVERDGPATLFIDNWPADGVGQAPAGDLASADEVVVTPWYTGEGPARLRGAVVADAVRQTLERRKVKRVVAETAHVPWSVLRDRDVVADATPILRRLREVKDVDELAAIRRGVKTAETVHAFSRELLEPGMTELEYYAELVACATPVAGQPFVMMCDLASGERAAAGGGAPTSRVIAPGDLVILDIFPYVGGYRGDITNTLVCGLEPTSAQSRVFDAVHEALQRAEALIRPGTQASRFPAVIDEVLADIGGRLVHHAGHAIGLGHPEAPELVPGSDRELSEGMVLTLEPGLYGQPTGGVRLEHDYLVTKDGFERLSAHTLALD